MSVSYDVFTGAFLDKVTEYNFPMRDYERNELVDGFMRRAISQFKHVCKYDFTTTGDDIIREFDVDVAEEDLDEIADIVSEGMLVQWMKPYIYKQELLENMLNTRDFSGYSPAEILSRVKDAYKSAQRDFVGMVREYSYNHGDLTDLHL